LQVAGVASRSFNEGWLCSEQPRAQLLRIEDSNLS
jgi:hypothetical protein